MQPPSSAVVPAAAGPQSPAAAAAPSSPSAAAAVAVSQPPPSEAVLRPQSPHLQQQNLRQALESSRTTLLTPTSGSGLKQRIRELEAIIESELKRLHREVYMYKNQKVVQSNTCETLVEEAKKELAEHLERSKTELKQFFVQQRSENLRLYDLIKTLRNENAVLQQTQLQLQRRLQSLEEDLGQ